MKNRGFKTHAHRKVIGVVLGALAFTVLVGGNLDNVKENLGATIVETTGGGACFRTVLEDGKYQGKFLGQLADCRSYQGCTYPDGSSCTRKGCFDAAGNKSLNSLSDWKVDWFTCLDEKGNDINAVVEEEPVSDDGVDVDYGDDYTDDGNVYEYWCERQDLGDQSCSVCKDTNGEEWEQDCFDTKSGEDELDEEWDDEDDYQQDNSGQLKDLQKEITRIEKELRKELLSIVKNAERSVKEYQQSYDRTKKDLERASARGLDEEWAEELNAQLEQLSAALNQAGRLVEDIKGISSDFDQEFDVVASYIDTLTASSSQEEIEAGWEKMWKLDFYRVRFQTAETRVNILETGGDFSNMHREVARLQLRYASVGEDLPDEVVSILEAMNAVIEIKENLMQVVDELDVAIAEASALEGDELREAHDSMWDLAQDLQWARENFWDAMDDFHWLEPWDILDQFNRVSGCFEMTGEMTEEIGHLRGEIEMAKEFAGAFFELGYMREDVAAAKILAENAIKLIEQMEKNLANICDGARDFDPREQVEKFWNAMDSIGESAEYHFGRLVKFIMNDSVAYDALVDATSEEIVSSVVSFITEEEDIEFDDVWEDEYDLDADASEIFKGLEGQLSDEVKKMIQRGGLSDEVMEELVNLIVDAVVEEITTRVIAHMDSLGEEFGNALISNNNVVAVEAVELDNAAVTMNDEEKRVLLGAKRTIYASNDTAKQVAEEIREFRTAKQSGDANSAKTRMNNINTLTQKAQEESTTGQNAFEFKDCRMNDEAWFVEDCIKARRNGIVSGYGNGNVGVTDNVIREHAVKMAAGACGKTVTANRTNWFKPYEDLYYKEGVNKVLDIHKDWKKQITREEAFALLAEICDITPTTYKNTWPDGGGKYSGHMQALYDKGIVTGEGNGKLNATGLINRAGFMKITNVASTSMKSSQFNSGLVEGDFDASKFLENGGQDWVSGEPGGEIGGGGAGSVNSGDPGGE